MSLHTVSFAVVPLLVACAGGRVPMGDDGDDDGTGPDASTQPDGMPSTNAAPPVINEVMRKPPDDAVMEAEIHEFIEIHGDPGVDYSPYTILQVRGQGDPGEPGIVRSVHPIGTTDGNGLWSTGYMTDVLKNSSETFLLVKNYTGSTAADTEDLDTDDDGAIDATPWDEIVDAIALEDDSAEGPTHFKYADVVLTPGSDGNGDEFEGASRVPSGVDTDTTADWVRNDPDGAGLPGFVGTPAANEAISTMAAPNQRGSSGPPAAAKISEAVFNHAGMDTAEFIEVAGSPSTDLSALTLVVLEGDIGAVGGAGVIDFTLAVGSTDTTGLWSSGMLDSMLENDSQTLLLVEGFTGTIGTDLDTDDNGTLDVQPWTSILDAVAVKDAGATDVTYAGGAVLTQGLDGVTFTYGGASRTGATDTDGAADWTRNDFDGEGLPFGMAGTATAAEAVNTPGLANRMGI